MADVVVGDDDVHEAMTAWSHVRPDHQPGYFGAFVRDPDGNNVEAVCHTPE